jgi:hypothetical protein
MTLEELYVFIGKLCNDPNHDRYSTSDIDTELDNTQDSWNLGAKIIKDTVTLTTVDGTRQYALSTLTGTPISFTRVTHKSLELKKRSKSYFDLYTGTDWTALTGTPSDYFVEVEDPDTQYLTVFRTPGSPDAGANLVVEYIKRHTAMSASSDVPFMSGSSSNLELRPYDFGVAYDTSSRLLRRDTSQENLLKAIGADGKSGYLGIANDVLADVVQVFKALEQEEPRRLRGGRYF